MDGHEYLNFSSADDLFEAIGDYYQEFIKRRVKEKILARVILRDSAKALERQKLGPGELRIVKIIVKDFEYHGAFSVFGNKIVFFSFVKDYMAVVIESKELADIQRACFENLWWLLS